MDQDIRFCLSPDGTSIAYAVAGDGAELPLVRAATWLTHLEHDLVTYPHWLEDFAADRRYVRYDMRGCGLSDRDVQDVSFEARVADLEAVVDDAGLDRFDLLGVSGGGCVAIAYAVRHPWRVAHLVLYGSFLQGRRRWAKTPAEREEERLLVDLTRLGWGREDSSFRSVFAARFMPDASAEVAAAYDEMQKVCSSGEMAARLSEADHDVDVTALATRVRIPALVIHVRGDAAAPFEEGRRTAAAIPGAKFVPLQGRNHIIGRDDPAWDRFVDETKRFCAGAAQLSDSRLHDLTARERDVLAFVAEGLDNRAIGDRLGLSARTVERHVAHIYQKFGVAGRSARAAVAARFAQGR